MLTYAHVCSRMQVQTYIPTYRCLHTHISLSALAVSTYIYHLYVGQGTKTDSNELFDLNGKGLVRGSTKPLTKQRAGKGTKTDSKEQFDFKYLLSTHGPHNEWSVFVLLYQ